MKILLMVLFFFITVVDAKVSESSCEEYIVSGVDNLNVRSEPSIDSVVVGVLKSGTTICIDKFEGKWGKIDSGWTSGKYLTKVNDQNHTVQVKTVNNKKESFIDDNLIGLLIVMWIIGAFIYGIFKGVVLIFRDKHYFSILILSFFTILFAYIMISSYINNGTGLYDKLENFGIVMAIVLVLLSLNITMLPRCKYCDYSKIHAVKKELVDADIVNDGGVTKHRKIYNIYYECPKCGEITVKETKEEKSV